MNLHFFYFLRYSGVSKDEIIGFVSHGHVQKSRCHATEELSVSPILKSKNLLVQNWTKMKQSTSTELNHIYNNIIGPT